MSTRSPHPAFGRFLAQHFGGYPTLQEAAAQESHGDEQRYVEDFFAAFDAELTEDGVRASERFLATWWEKPEAEREADCEKWFTDAGTPIPANMPSELSTLTLVLDRWN